jgi:hypothetical protein
MKVIQKVMANQFYQDVHIKKEVLGIYHEISKGFQKQEFSFLGAPKKEFFRGAEEVIKAMGILGHVHSVKEDNIDQKKFKLYSNEFFSISDFLNKTYLQQLAMAFERPSIVCAITSTLKT